MTVSYRTLAAIVGVVLIFGVVAAFLIGGDDDGDDTASGTSVTIERNDEGGVKTEDDEPGATTTSSSTTATTGGSSTTTTAPTTSTTGAAPGATTTTTRAPGATTTTRPPTTTTRPPATTQPTTPPTAPPTTVSNIAELGVHVNVNGSATARQAVIQVENAGPSESVDFTLIVSASGATIDSVAGGSFFPCSRSGTAVTCTATGVGRGGSVREVTINYTVDATCAGQPQLTASVSSPNRSDPGQVPNSRTASLCVFAGNG